MFFKIIGMVITSHITSLRGGTTKQSLAKRADCFTPLRSVRNEGEGDIVMLTMEASLFLDVVKKIMGLIKI